MLGIVLLAGWLGCEGNNSYGRLEAVGPVGMGTGGHHFVPTASGGSTGDAGGGLPEAGGMLGPSGAGAEGGAAGMSATSSGGTTASATGGRTSSSGGAAASGGASGTGGAGVVASGGRSATGGTTAGTGGAGAAGGGSGPLAFTRFRHGISLGNRLDAPMEGDWGPVLHATDFPLIARRGFDHVRLPARFSSHALTVAPYTVDAAFFARVDWAVQQAIGAGLAIIIDLANYDDLNSTPELQRDRFLALWRQIADHYRDAGSPVAFELLSEPSGALDASWNALAASALQIVRASNPTRVVIIASTNVASAATLPALTLPDDPNVMASIHAYEPTLFSFQGRAWIGPVWGTMGILFPGPPSTPLVPVAAAAGAPWASQWFADYNRLPADQNPSGPKTIQTEMQLIQDFKSRTGHAVYNGQWGPQAGGDAISRANYLRMVRGECDKAGVGWAIWEDQSNLTLFDPTTGAWVESLVAPLFP